MEEGSFVFYLNSSSIFNTKFESNLKPGRHTTIAKSSSKSFDRQKAGVFGGNGQIYSFMVHTSFLNYQLRIYYCIV